MICLNSEPSGKWAIKNGHIKKTVGKKSENINLLVQVRAIIEFHSIQLRKYSLWLAGSTINTFTAQYNRYPQYYIKTIFNFLSASQKSHNFFISRLLKFLELFYNRISVCIHIVHIKARMNERTLWTERRRKTTDQLKTMKWMHLICIVIDSKLKKNHT